MTNEHIKQLIDQLDKNALIIGLIYGGLTCILESNNKENITSELVYLRKCIQKHINSTYYDEKVEND